MSRLLATVAANKLGRQSTLSGEPQVGRDGRCDERESGCVRRPEGQVKTVGERQRDEKGEAERHEDEHLPRHLRNRSKVGRPQVHDSVDGEDHERHGQDYVSHSRMPASDLADGNDDEPGDHTVQDESGHARPRMIPGTGPERTADDGPVAACQ